MLSRCLRQGIPPSEAEFHTALEALSDKRRAKMSWRNHWLRAASWALVAVLVMTVVAAVFQYYVRYRYERLGGILWRVDQLTNQRCRVIGDNVDCNPPSSVSTSTSTSLSTSTSVSVRALAHRPH